MALNPHQVRKPGWWQRRSQACADARPPPGFWSSPGEATQPLGFCDSRSDFQPDEVGQFTVLTYALTKLLHFSCL